MESDIGDVWDRILEKQRLKQTLGPLERDISHVLDTDFELLSGGATGYITSSAFANVTATIGVLERVPAPRTKALLEKVCSYFPDGTPSANGEEREAQVAALPPAVRAELRSLDYDEENGRLRDLLLEYWNANTS